MKKFLTILLLSIIVIGGVWFAWHFYWVFGEGVKAGQLNNFMKKGFVFKTYEGKLIQTGLKGGTPGAVQSNEFRFVERIPFSVTNESVANQMMSNSGKEFEFPIKNIWVHCPGGVRPFLLWIAFFRCVIPRKLQDPYTP
ncbi:MAG: hypothetical protein WDM78_09730 [Puia sp.]